MFPRGAGVCLWGRKQSASCTAANLWASLRLFKDCGAKSRNRSQDISCTSDRVAVVCCCTFFASSIICTKNRVEWPMRQQSMMSQFWRRDWKFFLTSTCRDETNWKKGQFFLIKMFQEPRPLQVNWPIPCGQMIPPLFLRKFRIQPCSQFIYRIRIWFFGCGHWFRDFFFGRTALWMQTEVCSNQGFLQGLWKNEFANETTEQLHANLCEMFAFRKYMTFYGPRTNLFVRKRNGPRHLTMTRWISFILDTFVDVAKIVLWETQHNNAD